MSNAWAAGDYLAIAPYLQSASEEVVRAAAIEPGERVLDVACGNGNATVLAAQAGAVATGLDITPALIAAARERAPELEWVEGDAQALPLQDGHFDVVISTFGCIFAPDHARTAREMARVLRPGGRIVLAAWTPEGTAARMATVLFRHVPPPSTPSPGLWGDEAYVRTLLPGFAVSAESAQVHFDFASPEAATDFYARNFGPFVLARPAIADWDAFYADLLAFFTSCWAGDGWYGEYLILRATADGAGPT